MRPLLAIDLLPSSITNQDLMRLLSIFPGVRRTEVLRGRDGRLLGSAVVEVSHSAYRELIIQVLDGMEIDGQSLRVSRLDVSEPQPLEDSQQHCST